jgi:hypothetical protein
MNDLDLEAKLRSVPIPERPEEYWEDFPSRLRVQLRRRDATAAPRRPWRTPLIGLSNFALTAALVLICLQYHPVHAAAAAITQREKIFHGQLARLDHGLHRLILNTDGMGDLLVEPN